MNKRDHFFTVQYLDRSYIVLGNANTTLDSVWASQKCWYMPGSFVTIRDDQGNFKVFMKER